MKCPNQALGFPQAFVVLCVGSCKQRDGFFPSEAQESLSALVVE